ncbi:MAG: SMI1/KNR4 family protein [Lactococcus hircilactis]
MFNSKIKFLKQYSSQPIRIISNNFESLEGSIPQIWIEIFEENKNTRIEKILNLWDATLSKELSNTISYLRRFLKEVDLLKIGEKYYILYSIENCDTKKIGYYVGGNPKDDQTLASSHIIKYWKNLPKKLQIFYEKIHNGFYYFASRSMGIDELQEVDSLSEFYDNESDEYDLEYLFNFFSNGMGDYIVLDISREKDNAFIWWKEEKPEKVDIWSYLDEWITMGFYD